MGIYLRKNLSVGPLRFNLSSSGIGVSAGIKGLRVGTGPRGNYVQIGRGALSFVRKTGFSSQVEPPNSAKRVELLLAYDIRLFSEPCSIGWNLFSGQCRQVSS
jgi:hypothetical protein